MSDESSVVRPEVFDRFSGAHLAAAGFLARYSGRTREAYAADLRTYLTWCSVRSLDVFAASRPHIEIYVRWLEEDRHLTPATVARRLSTVIGFYRFMVIDGHLDKSPAEYVRRPRVSADSQALGLDRMQLGTLVAAARASGPTDGALITLLGLLGLRVSEACSVDIEDFGTQRGHRTVHIIGKGGKGITAKDAMQHVWGYTIINDVTARDWQSRHSQWLLGKSFDTFCPMGPWLVSADECDGSNTNVRCFVNGELRQNANTTDLIFNIPTLIETLSAGITLYPGDVIATGTPVGVGIGFKPPKYLQSGDVVRVEIDGIGHLENPVR